MKFVDDDDDDDDGGHDVGLIRCSTVIG